MCPLFLLTQLYMLCLVGNMALNFHGEWDIVGGMYQNG
jgi:hypothetical protein